MDRLCVYANTGAVIILPTDVDKREFYALQMARPNYVVCKVILDDMDAEQAQNEC